MNSELVVDASVAIKWFLPEIHSEAAGLILKTKCELMAPDLIWVEVGSILWKKVLRKEITVQEAEEILKDFLRFPVQTQGSRVLLSSAWQLANGSGATVYDSLYLSLANFHGCPLVTADRKFYESISKRTASSRVIWVEDIAKKLFKN